MLKMEMNVGRLKECLKGLADDMPVYVACNGECNYDFEKKYPREGTDTFVIVHNGTVFITDENEFSTEYGGNFVMNIKFKNRIVKHMKEADLPYECVEKFIYCNEIMKTNVYGSVEEISIGDESLIKSFNEFYPDSFVYHMIYTMDGEVMLLFIDRDSSDEDESIIIDGYKYYLSHLEDSEFVWGAL